MRSETVEQHAAVPLAIESLYEGVRRILQPRDLHYSECGPTSGIKVTPDIALLY
jgi:hypothetical protein